MAAKMTAGQLREHVKGMSEDELREYLSNTLHDATTYIAAMPDARNSTDSAPFNMLLALEEISARYYIARNKMENLVKTKSVLFSVDTKVVDNIPSFDDGDLINAVSVALIEGGKILTESDAKDKKDGAIDPKNIFWGTFLHIAKELNSRFHTAMSKDTNKDVLRDATLSGDDPSTKKAMDIPDHKLVHSIVDAIHSASDLLRGQAQLKGEDMPTIKFWTGMTFMLREVTRRYQLSLERNEDIKRITSNLSTLPTKKTPN